MNTGTNIPAGLQTAREYIDKLEADGFGWDILVGDAFVRGMRDIGYKSTSYALAELIDNAMHAAATQVDVASASTVAASPRALRLSTTATAWTRTWLVPRSCGALARVPPTALSHAVSPGHRFSLRPGEGSPVEPHTQRYRWPGEPAVAGPTTWSKQSPIPSTHRGTSSSSPRLVTRIHYDPAMDLSESPVIENPIDATAHVASAIGSVQDPVTAYGHTRSELAAIGKLYVEMVLRPHQYCKRITERCSLNRWTVERKVTFAYHIPTQAGLSRAVLPLMAVTRGRSFIDFGCSNEGGDSVPVLSRTENQTMASLAIHSAAQEIVEAYWTKPIPGDQRDLELEGRIIRKLAGLPYKTPDVARLAVKEFLQISTCGLRRNFIDALQTSSPFRELIEVLSVNYYIAVVLPPDTRLDRPLVHLSYSKPYIERAPEGKWMRIRGWMRSFMGSAPSVFSLAMDLSRSTNSYHIRMLGPGDHFVWEQTVRYQNSPDALSNDLRLFEDLLSMPIQGRPSSPSNHAHLNISRAREVRGGRLFARFKFYEIPPGSQGLAALLCVVNAILLTVTTIDLRDLTKSASVVSAVPALLLAIPATFSVVSFPSYTASLSQAPLRSRLGMFAVAATSLSGAISVTFLSSKEYTTGLTRLTYGFWCSLILICVLMSAWTAWGARYNRGCLHRALEISRQRVDSLSLDDIQEVKKRK